MKFTFDYTEDIVDRALGKRCPDRVFYEVHELFTNLLNSGVTIPEDAYDGIVRSLANAYRYGARDACERISNGIAETKHNLVNYR